MDSLLLMLVMSKLRHVNFDFTMLSLFVNDARVIY